MKTAKDILRDHKIGIIKEDSTERDWVMADLSNVVQAMKEYARLKCQEQKKLCTYHIQMNMFTEKIVAGIHAAPDPQFD